LPPYACRIDAGENNFHFHVSAAAAFVLDKKGKVFPHSPTCVVEEYIYIYEMKRRFMFFIQITMEIREVV
jgi:hypothetical protein